MVRFAVTCSSCLNTIQYNCICYSLLPKSEVHTIIRKNVKALCNLCSVEARSSYSPSTPANQLPLPTEAPRHPGITQTHIIIYVSLSFSKHSTSWKSLRRIHLKVLPIINLQLCTIFPVQPSRSLYLTALLHHSPVSLFRLPVTSQCSHLKFFNRSIAYLAEVVNLF